LIQKHNLTLLRHPLVAPLHPRRAQPHQLPAAASGAIAHNNADFQPPLTKLGTPIPVDQPVGSRAIEVEPSLEKVAQRIRTHNAERAATDYTAGIVQQGNQCEENGTGHMPTHHVFVTYPCSIVLYDSLRMPQDQIEVEEIDADSTKGRWPTAPADEGTTVLLLVQQFTENALTASSLLRARRHYLVLMLLSILLMVMYLSPLGASSGPSGNQWMTQQR